MSLKLPYEDNVVTEFNAMKLKKSTTKFITFKMDKEFKKISIDAQGDSNTTYDDFKKTLPDKECRYGVVNIDYELEDGGKRDKLLFVFWAPDNAPTKMKMTYSSAKNEFKTALNGIQCDHQANGHDDITFEKALEKCKKNSN